MNQLGFFFIFILVILFGHTVILTIWRENILYAISFENTHRISKYIFLKSSLVFIQSFHMATILSLQLSIVSNGLLGMV